MSNIITVVASYKTAGWTYTFDNVEIGIDGLKIYARMFNEKKWEDGEWFYTDFKSDSTGVLPSFTKYGFNSEGELIRAIADYAFRYREPVQS